MERTSNSVSKSGVGSLDFEPLQRSEIDLFMGSGSSSFETQHGKKESFFFLLPDAVSSALYLQYLTYSPLAY